MLDGDVGSSTRGDIFEAAHPDRYLQMGIAEQNMLGVAAGLATMGLIPFISTFVSFAVVRPLDQIRVLIAQTGLNVKITPGYAGLFTGMTGMSHIIVDDMAIMRAMPGMVTVAPADDIEADQVLRWAARYDGPVLRPARPRRDAAPLRRRLSVRVRKGGRRPRGPGRDAHQRPERRQPAVVDAAELLADRGIDAHVLHVPTIKPVDVEGIVAAAEKTGRVITVEEHTVIGGLGGPSPRRFREHRPTRRQPDRAPGSLPAVGAERRPARHLRPVGVSGRGAGSSHPRRDRLRVRLEAREGLRRRLSAKLRRAAGAEGCPIPPSPFEGDRWHPRNGGEERPRPARCRALRTASRIGQWRSADHVASAPGATSVM